MGTQEWAVVAAAGQLAGHLAAPFPVTYERAQRMGSSLAQLHCVHALAQEASQAGAPGPALTRSITRALAELARPLAAFAASSAHQADLAGGLHGLGAFTSATQTALTLQTSLYNLIRAEQLPLTEAEARSVLAAASLPLNTALRVARTLMAQPEGSAISVALDEITGTPLASAMLWSASMTTTALLHLMDHPLASLPSRALADAQTGILGDAALVRCVAEAAQVASQACAKHGALALPAPLMEALSIVACTVWGSEAFKAAPVCQLAVVQLLARLISDPQLLQAAAASTVSVAGSSGQHATPEGDSGQATAAEAGSDAALHLLGAATGALCYGALQEGRQRWQQVPPPGQQLLHRAVALTRLLPAAHSVLHSRAINLSSDASTWCLLLEASAVRLVAVLLLDGSAQQLDPAVAAFTEAVPYLYALVAAAAGTTTNAFVGADSSTASQHATLATMSMARVLVHVHSAIYEWAKLAQNMANGLKPPALHTPAACQAMAAAAEALLRMIPLLPQVPLVPVQTGSRLELACWPAGSSGNVVTGEIATHGAFEDLLTSNPPQGLALVSPAIVIWLLTSIPDIDPRDGGASTIAGAQQGAAAGDSSSSSAQHSARQTLAASSTTLWAAAMSACKHLWAGPRSSFASSTAARLGRWHDPAGNGEPGTVLLHACRGALMALFAAMVEGSPDAQRRLDCLAVCFVEALQAPAFASEVSMRIAALEFLPACLAGVILSRLVEAPQVVPLLLIGGGASTLRNIVAQMLDAVRVSTYPPEQSEAVLKAVSKLTSIIPANDAEELPAGGEVAVRRARALALRPCGNPRCPNLSGASETEVKGKRCSGCRVVRFCCAQCLKAEWRQHKVACRLLAAGQEG